ncbi:ribosome hibernation-promoting factor, HPF/YfiA family [Actinopolymorpha alba]|uniref:ribosome hibernation-promoting factor, HPF/YfiA family n=1 Tax=Actinopolymorpha alba TaxID=533267 RepID=UPI000375F07A|nr:ribosome-associated translation inhibitor RaiA [Actinopolymorpha alba]
MDVVVQGRHCAVTDRFRRHVREKFSRLERFAAKIIRIEVEVSKEHTRMANQSERVELTVYSRGPLVRAEATAEDRFAALDLALDKLLARLRKAADRRRVHHGARTPKSVARATAEAAEDNGRRAAEAEQEAEATTEIEVIGGIEVVGDGPLVVREKTHLAEPMTLDQALYEMELVGHDFYLFVDATTLCPSVVYRRRGYDYGVIRLEGAAQQAALATVARRG